MNPIEQMFASRGVVRGAFLKLRPQVALEMVRECRKRGIRVLGLDAFTLTDTTTQPHMAESIDLSWPLRQESQAWDEAEAFLAERLQSDFYFEVVIASP